MQKNKKVYIIAGLVLLVIVVWMITTYDSLVKKEENLNKQWAEVQNTYQRRIDLLPNLVKVVKGSSEFEQSTLIEIVNSRASRVRVSAGLNPEEQQSIQDSFATATNRALAVIESYPDLKGTQAFATLQAQIEGTERRIKFARTDYNAAVADYNRKVRSFPTNMIASIFGFGAKDGFKAAQGADQAVEIKF